MLYQTEGPRTIGMDLRIVADLKGFNIYLIAGIASILGAELL